jgi:hypothetical protein
MSFDPKEASGEASVQSGRSLELNEVSLNGDGSAKEVEPGKWKRNGGYFRERILIGNSTRTSSRLRLRARTLWENSTQSSTT